jgi:hypothetical protein
MSRLLVRSFAVALDGFGAGPNQSLENPLGERGSVWVDRAIADSSRKRWV